jgi:hypothetical protein
MQRLIQILSTDKNQRIINGLIFLILLFWITAKLKYVHYASGDMVHYKYYLLLLIALIYLSQTILNKTWINFITRGFYAILIGYVLCTYIYSFFDENDFVAQKEYGALIKSGQTFVKLAILSVILWLAITIRPISKKLNPL